MSPARCAVLSVLIWVGSRSRTRRRSPTSAICWNGTIVDATIIGAPSSTKNKDKARDPERHQTKKGKQWYFGMKVPIGVDSKTKQIHGVG